MFEQEYGKGEADFILCLSNQKPPVESKASAKLLIIIHARDGRCKHIFATFLDDNIQSNRKVHTQLWNLVFPRQTHQYKCMKRLKKAEKSKKIE